MLDDAVNLKSYPIDALDSPAGRVLVASCREQLCRLVMLELPHILRPEAVGEVLQAVTRARPRERYHFGRSRAVDALCLASFV